MTGARDAVQPDVPGFERTRGQVSDLLAEACAALQRLGRRSAAEQVRQVRAQFLAGHVTVAVAGEFKRGKSTLCGALVDDPALFPVDVDIATNLVTSVEYAANERITVLTGDADEPEGRLITRDEIRSYTTEQGNPGNRRNVRLLRVQAPLPRLHAGTVLLDTPGAGGLNSDHTAVTYAILGSVDVVVFVIDALTPMTVAEIAMLETIAALDARILLAITKTDKVDDPSAAVANARLKLVGVLGEVAGGRVPVVPISSTAKLDWLRSGDEESYEVSGFRTLESTLSSLLEGQGGALLIARALGRAVRHLDDVVASLEAELAAPGEATFEARQARTGLVQGHQQVVELRHPDADWRARLAESCSQMRATAESRLVAELDAVAAGLEPHLKASDLLEREQSLLSGLERDVTLAWSRLVRDTRAQMGVVSDEIEVMTGLHPNPVLLRGGTLTAFSTFGSAHRQPAGGHGSPLEALGWVGGLIGWFVDDALISVASAVISFLGGRWKAASGRREELASDVREQVSRVRRELQERLTALLDAAEDATSAGFEALIATRQGRLEAADEALRGPAPDAQRVASLRDALAELSDIRSRALYLAQRLASPSPSTLRLT